MMLLLSSVQEFENFLLMNGVLISDVETAHSYLHPSLAASSSSVMQAETEHISSQVTVTFSKFAQIGKLYCIG